MKTGDFIYEDGSSSTSFDKDKKVVGVWCNVTDDYGCAVSGVESENKLEWAQAQDFCQKKGMRCPTIDELTGIYLNRDKINISLEKAGFAKLKDDWYWSSTEYSANHAWGILFSSGPRDADYKYGPWLNVRPVLAL